MDRFKKIFLKFFIIIYFNSFALSSQTIMQDCNSLGTGLLEHHSVRFGKELQENLKSNNLNEVRHLLLSGASTPNNLTPKEKKIITKERNPLELIPRSARGDIGRMVTLLKAGADPNVSVFSDEYMSPLVWAARCNQARAIDVLVRNGALVDLECNFSRGRMACTNSTALIWACREGSVDSARTLLNHHANPNAQERYLPEEGKTLGMNGWTALIASSAGGSDQITAMLLDAGADPNLRPEQGKTALMLAAARNKLDLVQALLDHGADPALVDWQGNSAESLARGNGYDALAQHLRSWLVEHPGTRGSKGDGNG